MKICRSFFKGAIIPNYSAHKLTNCIVGIPFIYYGFYEQQWADSQYVCIASLSFAFSTFFLSPDLDLPHSIPTKNWGAFRVLWVGYPYLFRHRGKSHSLLFSSFTKLLYLSFVGVLVLAIAIFVSKFQSDRPLLFTFQLTRNRVYELLQEGTHHLTVYKGELLAILVGVIGSDWIHIFTDKAYSALKKLI